MPLTHERDSTYSSTTGVIFLFNLIVGTGALALPGALQRAGYLIGVGLLLVLALFSFITVTYIIESLAAANALTRKRYSTQGLVNDTEESVEETPLVTPQETEENDIFEIREKYEIGQMGVLLTPTWCQVIIYLSLCIYLFGDVAIYAAVIGRSGSHIICQFNPNSSDTDDHMPCWNNHSLSRMSMYRIVVAVFVLTLGPFVFFNLQKTKFLQIFTSFMRWLAFFIMLIWSIILLSTRGAEGHPSIVDFKSLPNLFGTLVYSYMCQHSVPGLVQPIRNKRQIKVILGIDYALVSFFYITLAMTAVFTFQKVADIYPLNFWADGSQPIIIKILAYFLALFPVFTISTNFPIIAITLRNNLRNMILRDAPFRWYYDKLLFPLLAIIPSSTLALAVSDIQFLVGIVGSYAGACVQYLIPCLLVYFARVQTKDFYILNMHTSPFKHKAWIIAVYVWMAISLIFITINYALKLSHK